MGSAGLAEDPRLAVNVIGFLDDSLGLAQAARLYIDALRAAGVPVATHRDRTRRTRRASASRRPSATAGAPTTRCGRRSSRPSTWPA